LLLGPRERNSVGQGLTRTLRPSLYPTTEQQSGIFQGPATRKTFVIWRGPGLSTLPRFCRWRKKKKKTPRRRTKTPSFCLNPGGCPLGSTQRAKLWGKNPYYASVFSVSSPPPRWSRRPEKNAPPAKLGGPTKRKNPQKGVSPPRFRHGVPRGLLVLPAAGFHLPPTIEPSGCVGSSPV